jgi:uncharacterized protein YoxC
MTKLIPVEKITNKILFLRNEKVLLDRDLAALYGVSTKALNQAVKRNARRFPSDFMFRLTKKEKDELVTNCDRFKPLKHASVSPRAFTEQGVAMLSSVLNSQRAIEVNIAIMRAFIHLRKMISSQTKLAKKLKELEHHIQDHDKTIQAIFEAIQQLISLPDDSQKKIGFTAKETQKSNEEKQKMKRLPARKTTKG